MYVCSTSPVLMKNINNFFDGALRTLRGSHLLTAGAIVCVTLNVCFSP